MIYFTFKCYLITICVLVSPNKIGPFMKENASGDKIYVRSDDWHTLPVDESLARLSTTPEGLSGDEAVKRLARYGENSIQEKDKASPWILLLNQFKSLLIMILISAALISAAIGEIVEATAIIVIVILAGVIGFFQEFQAGKALEALKKMAAPLSTALRDGKETEIEASKLVPGDVIIISTGDQIPADCRLIKNHNLQVNEAALTGESLPVHKTIEINPEVKAPIGDRTNMLFMGTSASYGHGRAVVVNTGMNTEFGTIAELLQSSESRKTPLQNNLDDLGKKLGIWAIILAALMSLLGIYRGYEIVEMFVWGVALAVAVIPEALPAVVTITIALGVRRMVKRKALIRKLPAVETLGSTNIICSDKTGTLTRDEMTAKKIFAGDKVYEVKGSGYEPEGSVTINGKPIDSTDFASLHKIYLVGALCSDTVLQFEEGKWGIIGDPTEGALVTLAQKGGFNVADTRETVGRVDEIPFSSETKRMTTIHNIDGSFFALSKGAPEVIIYACKYYFLNGKLVELTDAKRDEILNVGYGFGSEALRVLGLAYKDIDENFDKTEIEKEQVFVGLVGMMDPPREEAKEAIKKCFHAGIRPKMITGDHKVTAVAVARELGILTDGDVVEGRELENFTDEELDKVTETAQVYARISPSHKLRIVESLMKKGHIVTMTGDGVNDAPSLKKADIGVAMGIKGTDVSREASDMILTDDNFASIVAAVEEGRSIFLNIKKYLVYLLSGNMGTVIAMVIALFSNLPLPLMAVQVLFINFLMDGLMAIALGLEPSEPGIMEHKPRDVNRSIISGEALFFTLGIGTWIGLADTAVFIYALNAGYDTQHAVTIFFAALILSRIFNAGNCRSFEQSAFSMNPLGNKTLLVSAILSLLFTVIVIYWDIMNVPFHTAPLGYKDWILAGISGTSVLIVVEIAKFLKRKFQTEQSPV